MCVCGGGGGGGGGVTVFVSLQNDSTGTISASNNHFLRGNWASFKTNTFEEGRVISKVKNI